MLTVFIQLPSGYSVQASLVAFITADADEYDSSVCSKITL